VTSPRLVGHPAVPAGELQTLDQAGGFAAGEAAAVAQVAGGQVAHAGEELARLASAQPVKISVQVPYRSR